MAADPTPRFEPHQILNSDDATIADLFIRQFGERHRYIRDSSEWILWCEDHWTRESTHQAVYDDLALLKSMLTAMSRGNGHCSPLVKKLSNNRTLNAIYSHLCVCGAISMKESDMDARANLIAFNGGVFDCASKQVITEPAEIRSFYMLKRMNASIEEGARCPRWKAFLARVFEDDQELIGFVQKAVGLSLSGNVHEELLFSPMAAAQMARRPFSRR
ncbi:MAG: hypothetical protein Q8M98_07185 [Candidatus Cloacimonadaceae bacterium]|nr:hypothetical protein [Candidatus Cloacimonadaceae bacterium]MDP3114545.1 hypothetical protein [Candidatus Cloacimonadaceae bacterium]